MSLFGRNDLIRYQSSGASLNTWRYGSCRRLSVQGTARSRILFMKFFSLFGHLEIFFWATVYGNTTKLDNSFWRRSSFWRHILFDRSIVLWVRSLLQALIVMLTLDREFGFRTLINISTFEPWSHVSCITIDFRYAFLRAMIHSWLQTVLGLINIKHALSRFFSSMVLVIAFNGTLILIFISIKYSHWLILGWLPHRWYV